MTIRNNPLFIQFDEQRSHLRSIFGDTFRSTGPDGYIDGAEIAMSLYHPSPNRTFVQKMSKLSDLHFGEATLRLSDEVCRDYMINKYWGVYENWVDWSTDHRGTKVSEPISFPNDSCEAPPEMIKELIAIAEPRDLPLLERCHPISASGIKALNAAGRPGFSADVLEREPTGRWSSAMAMAADAPATGQGLSFLEALCEVITGKESVVDPQVQTARLTATQSLSKAMASYENLIAGRSNEGERADAAQSLRTHLQSERPKDKVARLIAETAAVLNAATAEESRSPTVLMVAVDRLHAGLKELYGHRTADLRRRVSQLDETISDVNYDANSGKVTEEHAATTTWAKLPEVAALVRDILTVFDQTGATNE